MASERTSQAWDYLLEREYKQEITKLEEHLSEGTANSYEEYKYFCGQIRGIRFAMDCINRLREKYGDEDDAQFRS